VYLTSLYAHVDAIALDHFSISIYNQTAEISN